MSVRMCMCVRESVYESMCLSVSLCMNLCECVWGSIGVRVCVNLWGCMCACHFWVFAPVWVYAGVSVSMWVCKSMSAYTCEWGSMCVGLYESVCVGVYVWVCLPVRMFMCIGLSVWVSMWECVSVWTTVCMNLHVWVSYFVYVCIYELVGLCAHALVCVCGWAHAVDSTLGHALPVQAWFLLPGAHLFLPISLLTELSTGTCWGGRRLACWAQGWTVSAQWHGSSLRHLGFLPELTSMLTKRTWEFWKDLILNS